MHEKPLTPTGLLGHIQRNFDSIFGNLTATEDERRDYARYVREMSDNPLIRAGLGAPLSFEAWRKTSANRGNQEGQNHD